MFQKFFACTGLFFFLLGFVSPQSFSAEKKKKSETAEIQPSCAFDLESVTELKEFESLLKKYSIRDFLNPDATQNLAVRFPTAIMDAYQVGWYGIQSFGSRRVLDPTYRISRTTLWNAFHTGVQEANRQRIIGHYDVVSQYVNLIKKGARGDKTAQKMILFVGPAGTGKTEILSVQYYLSTRLKNLEYLTWDWKNLGDIPALKAILKRADGQTILENQLKRSPITLFPPSLQTKITEMGAAKVDELIGIAPRPFLYADPHTEEVLDILVRHYAETEWGGNAPTEAQYLAMLEKHVTVVPRRFNSNQPPLLLRYQGKEPKYHELFFQENMMRMMTAPPGSALGYDYTGRVPQTDGTVTGWDEYFRNIAALRNTTLELVQNRVLDFGGARPLFMNVISIASSNDESIQEASEDGATKAQIQRLVRLNMRQSIHPLEIIQTTLLMLGESSFTMRNLDKPGAVEEPLDLLKVFPLPAEDGRLSGSDGRYAISYKVSKNEPSILISPRALMLLGLTTAATRLVTDPQQAKDFSAELDIVRQSATVFTNHGERLGVILGEIEADNSTRLELSRLKELLKEGQNGLQSRDVQRWLADALSSAEAHGKTLTPTVMDQTFQTLLDSEGMEYSKAQRGEWLRYHRMMKSQFIMKYLARDLNSIIGGDKNKLMNLYRDIKNEINARGSDPKAKTFDEPSGERRAINDKRLNAIYEIYREVNGRDLKLDQLRAFHTSHSESEAVFPPLVTAIERYLLQAEMDTQSMTSLYDALVHKKGDHDSMLKAERAEANLERLGYNRRSFEEALRFIIDVQMTENQ